MKCKSYNLPFFPYKVDYFDLCLHTKQFKKESEDSDGKLQPQSSRASCFLCCLVFQGMMKIVQHSKNTGLFTKLMRACETDPELYPVKHYTRCLLFLAPFGLLLCVKEEACVPISSSDLPLRCANTVVF